MCFWGARLDIQIERFFGKNWLGCHSSAKDSAVGFQSYIGGFSGIDNTIVGRYSCISHHVVVVQGRYPTSQFVSLHPAFFQQGSRNSYVDHDLFDSYRFVDEQKRIACVIGNDVWIGYGALIMAGVQVGDGAIVAAASGLYEILATLNHAIDNN